MILIRHQYKEAKTNMIDDDHLRELAKRVTHPKTKGRWIRLFGERTVYDRLEDGCRGNAIVRTDYPNPGPEESAYLDYIAAADPETVTSLLDRLVYADSVITALRDSLQETVQERDELRIISRSNIESLNDLQAKYDLIKNSKQSAADKKRKKEKLASSDWCTKLEIVVLDPDGWDRNNFESSWSEKITEEEFRSRVDKSTVRLIMPKID